MLEKEIFSTASFSLNYSMSAFSVVDDEQGGRE